eukprot:scaffold156770_cov21-Tisochrysis_lutea.AAC.1
MHDACVMNGRDACVCVSEKLKTLQTARHDGLRGTQPEECQKSSSSSSSSSNLSWKAASDRPFRGYPGHLCSQDTKPLERLSSNSMHSDQPRQRGNAGSWLAAEQVGNLLKFTRCVATGDNAALLGAQAGLAGFTEQRILAHRFVWNVAGSFTEVPRAAAHPCIIIWGGQHAAACRLHHGWKPPVCQPPAHWQAGRPLHGLLQGKSLLQTPCRSCLCAQGEA